MQLVSMEIDGFKSFAHKTTIKFQSGMTGIIGPNGSGKSNVIEAIRWVMGEQSAKNLRGGKMVDVIFNGSKDHHPLNRAVVKMTLDNSDHYLQSEYSEITVTRKLYRNGDSEYLINDRRVRLKDIVDLFIDSGIGRESFSIISQGRVAEVFNGQSSDRRRIIETVAGVAKYKQNKITAEKKLQETGERLDRVNDIVVELERRLDPLKEESSLAQDYLEQKQKLDQFDRTRTVRQVLNDQEQLAAIRQQLTNANQLSAQYDRQVQQSKATLQKLQASRRQVLQKKDQAQNLVTAKVEEIAKLKNQQSLSSIRQEQREKDQQRLQTQKQQVNEQQVNLQAQLEQNEQEVAKLKAKILTGKKELKDLQSLSAAEHVKKLQHQLEQLQEEQVDLMQQQTTLHNERVYLKQNHERHLNVVKQDQQNLVENQQQLTVVRQKLDDYQSSQRASKDAFLKVKQELNTANQHRQKLQEQYEQTQRKWYQSLGVARSAEQQVKNYQAMLADYTGYYAGVQTVLKARQQFPGLSGSVSELIKVPAQYTTAIETVLGSQLQQLVVDNQNTGKQIINYLVRQRGGRVTILPLDTIRPGWTPATLTAIKQLPGLIGPAIELIQYPARFSKVVEHLLSTTVVVDNLDHATTISRAGRHQLRVVTLDGQLINASGAMTGGANRHQRQGLLSQKQQLTHLKQNAAQEQTTATALEDQVQKLVNARQANQQMIQELQTQFETKRQTMEQTQTAMKVTQDRLKELQRRAQAFKFQSNQQNDQQTSFAKQLKTNEIQTVNLNQQLADAKEQVQSIKKQITKLESNASSQNQVIHQLEQQLAVDEERQRQFVNRHDEFSHQQIELQQQVREIEQQIRELADGSNDDENNDRNQEAALEKANGVLSNARQIVSECSHQQTTLEGQIDQATAENERLQELTRAVLDDVSGLNDQKGHLEAEIDQGLNKLSEQYSMTLNEAQQNQAEISNEELQRQIKLLKRGLAELGHVNLGSIDEYKEVAHRYQFLNGQKEDLLAAKAQLESTMNKMDDQVKQRFIQTFNQVSKSFTKTFQQIFNGGQAKLILTDPDDLLETGVDIMAQPPGKKNQQLSLLSGGEKALTAIALLFAILKVRPVPFAILDEPEAALDDVNVDRFANYLERFGNSGPQFIVITHRKGTMRNADVLYGVTMQESGISEVVSVDVNKTLGNSKMNDEVN
ncbi:chromosome segregation protein SMC [uncultured Limosilactobacillus sp.]|uniref:chromosome segregation protein SMC n=1 Tax=uncultured Limosilactobacillus sp. TaxID=2837629 RepID=UPI0025D0B518|nr:chromosome segregation protein SMC [uncultured Limosilactobacillus sp.]